MPIAILQDQCWLKHPRNLLILNVFAFTFLQYKIKVWEQGIGDRIKIELNSDLKKWLL